MNKLFAVAGAMFGLLAVILGALSAHSLKEVLPAEEVSAFHTGVEYQFYHALALLLTSLLMTFDNNKLMKTAGYCFITGIVFFSGSIYLLTTASVSGLKNISWLGPITPLGGLFFITGWLCLLLAFLRLKK